MAYEYINKTLVNGQEYSSNDITVLMNGVALSSVASIDYSDVWETRKLRGLSPYAHAYAYGMYDCSVSLTLNSLKEVMALQNTQVANDGQLFFNDLFDIQVIYNANFGNETKIDVIKDCKINTNSRTIATNSDMEVTLEVMASRIIWGK